MERKESAATFLGATSLRVAFEYVNFISVLLYLSGTGECMNPAAGFKGIQEPRPSDGLYAGRMSFVITEGLVSFWRCGTGLFDSHVFGK